MVGNLNFRNRIFIAHAVVEILVTVLAERIYSSIIQVFDSPKDISIEEKLLLQESPKLLDIGKMKQTLLFDLITKHKEFLRNNEKAFYKRRKLKAQIDELLEQPHSLLKIGKASKKPLRVYAGIDSSKI